MLFFGGLILQVPGRREGAQSRSNASLALLMGGRKCTKIRVFMASFLTNHRDRMLCASPVAYWEVSRWVCTVDLRFFLQFISSSLGQGSLKQFVRLFSTKQESLPTLQLDLVFECQFVLSFAHSHCLRQNQARDGNGAADSTRTQHKT